MKKLISIMSSHYHFKLDFKKVDQHTRGKRLIRRTKHRKEISRKPWPPLYKILVENLNIT